MVDVFFPIDWFATEIVKILLNEEAEKGQLGASLHFFIYDSIKIIILLFCISFVVGFIKTFSTPEKTKKYLSGKKMGLGNVLAALFGIITPFCSCSACPLFIGFLEAGIPLGITFSYLISAPMINEVAVILLWGLFGFRVTAIYVISGLVIAIISGIIIGKLRLERFVESFVFETKVNSAVNLQQEINFKTRINEAKESSFYLVKKVWIFIIIGVAIGSFIHGYVPENLLTQLADRKNVFAVPIAVLIGIPLYANIAGVLPVTEVLVSKGLPIGTVLAFTMSVTALSVPEMIILRRVLKPQLLAIFFGVVALAIIFTGFLFNVIL